MADLEPADLDRLAGLGFDPDFVSEEQLQVLASLSDAELGLIADVKRRLDEAADVEAHGIEGGALLW